MKKLPWFIAGLVVLGVIIFSTPSENPPTTTQETDTFTRVQVAEHNSAESCYTIVSTSVYDVTSWIAKHPGGRDAILSLCGKDGTAAFTKQHGSNAKAQAALKSFLIGALQ